MSRATPSSRPIGLTPGEPAGIGPELALMIAARGTPQPLVVFADPRLLDERTAALELRVTISEVAPPYDDVIAAPRTLFVHPVPLASLPMPGAPDAANAPALLSALDEAIAGCRSGSLAAMVTGPINKAVINDAGIPFSGHTEYIARACGDAEPVMMLAGGDLKVALATTHLPLAAVASAITRPRLRTIIETLHGALKRYFRRDTPRILVLGLNPHAGEQGHLGMEEQQVIEPVLEELRARGLELLGPVPADTAFNRERLAECDAVLAMYHDQGLPVLKYASFGEAVNITLGLPIVRTSVDHGTAFDLAGSGRADPGSLLAAIDIAAGMAEGAA